MGLDPAQAGDSDGKAPTVITEVRGFAGQLRETHHRLAHMIALGMSDSMIRRMTGITQKRLNIYKADPAFQNLVAELHKDIDEVQEEAISIQDSLMTFNRVHSEIAIAEAIQAHLDGEREISLSILDRIAQGRMDRQGYGKTSKVEHKHDFAIRLEQAIQRSEALQAERGFLIEGSAQPPIDLPPGASDLHGAAKLVPITTEAAPAPTKAPRPKSEPPLSRNLASVLGLQRRRFA